ncbi:hypothetical protein scyTo_0019877 [Scyliorhinus torazame]|uniref:Integrin alpha first immunoglubulin-like domain-containing protein n=1 Tax=Scyliorhinus torazame TaxID=75743 RepID=A0A401PTF7_SCYTO|nr:hypothetical protein [Scyliorhinus torazame]
MVTVGIILSVVAVSTDYWAVLSPRLERSNTTCEEAHFGLWRLCTRSSFVSTVVPDGRGCGSSDFPAGHGIPGTVVLNASLQLDRLKQKGGIERTLFLNYHRPQHTFQLVIGKLERSKYQEFIVYLTDEKDFRDKLTPISVSLNYSLDDSYSSGDLKPIINYYSETFLQKQVNKCVLYRLKIIIKRLRPL